MVILETTAPKFISNLFKKVIDQKDIGSLLDVLSISIKSIFFIVH